MSLPVQLSNCKVDLIRRVAEHEDCIVRLTTREAALLSFLVQNPNRTITRDEIHAEVWGYGPAIITRAADDTLRRLRPKIGENPKAPVHILTVHGEGYRFVPIETSEPITIDTTPPSIPRPRTTFFGRDSEFTALRESVEGGASLITVLGPGGMGKTRLTLECSQRLMENRTNIWFVDASEATTDMGFIDEIVRVLGINPGDVSQMEAAATRIGTALSTVHMPLLILDNLEQLGEAAAQVIDQILLAAPSAQIIATSRFRLDLEGEQVISLGPLDIDDAVLLFEDRARVLAYDFELSAEDHGVVHALTRQLDGLPLAIELAAARTPTMSVVELKDALVDGLDALRGRNRGRPDRHQTIEATLQWTWDLLDPWAQSALAQCSVFRHSFALWTAEAVIDLSIFPDAPAVDQVIETLLDCSLIHTSSPIQHAHQIRFSLYETVRHFAKTALEEAGQVQVVQARMNQALLSWVEPQGDTFAHIAGDEIRKRVGLEFNSLIAIARHSPHNEERARAFVSAGAGVIGGHTRIVSAWNIVEEIDFDSLPPELCIETQFQASRCGLILGHLDQALDYAQRARDAAKELGLARLQISSTASLSYIYMERGDANRARTAMTEAIAVAREAGDPQQLGFLMVNEGFGLQSEGDNVRARATLREATKLLDGAGMDYMQFFIQIYMAQIERNEGRMEQAYAHAMRGLELAETSSDPSVKMMGWTEAGTILLGKGRDHSEEAAEFFRRANDLALRTFHIRAQTYTSVALATALHAMGRNTEAVQITRDNLDQSISKGLASSEIRSHALLAIMTGENGSWAEAEQLCLASLGPARGHSRLHLEPDVLAVLAQVLYETGRIDEAIARATEAKEIFKKLNTTHRMLKPLLLLALCALKHGDQPAMRSTLDEAVQSLALTGDSYNSAILSAFRSICFSCVGAKEDAQHEVELLRRRPQLVESEELNALAEVATALIHRASGDTASAHDLIASATRVGAGAEDDVVNPNPGGRFPNVRMAIEVFHWSGKG